MPPVPELSTYPPISNGFCINRPKRTLLFVLVAIWFTFLCGQVFPDSPPPDMVLIPGGTFEMGDSLDGFPAELPVHTVRVDSFYMGRYEIANQQYCDYLNSAISQGLITVTGGVVYKAGSGTSYPYCYNSTGSSWSQIAYSGGVFTVRTKSGRDMSNDPMVEVSWYGAAAYCNWRSQEEGKEQCYNLSTWDCDFSKKGYRLATEAEWEYAARGGLSGSRFPWGDTISHSQANYLSISAYSCDVSPTRRCHPTWNDGVEPYTSPVGSFTANGYGLCDMAGNVLEWCNDWLDSDYYDYSPTDNPTGPISGGIRVKRGGSWHSNAYGCRVASRGWLFPHLCSRYDGFRIVLPADASPGFLVLKEPLAIDKIYSLTDGIFTDCYFTSLLGWLPLNTQDPLRDVLPFGDALNSVFGNSLETGAGWVSLGQGYQLDYLGFKEQGQWSRLGQVIDPAYGMLIFEAGSTLREWRTRELTTDSLAVFQYHSSDPSDTQDDFEVSLGISWRCLGLAKEDSVAWAINHAEFLRGIVQWGITGTVDTAMEISTVLFCWDIMADNFELYGVGESLLPEDSSLRAWVYGNVVLERPDRTQLGILGAVFGGWPGHEPLKSGSYDSNPQVHSSSEVMTLPVGEPVQVRLELKTHAEAKGAAESYAGILGYELKIQGPPGTEPLIFTGTDPSPNDVDLSRSLASSLLQAAETEAFVAGPVYSAESFGESNSVNDTGVVVLPIDANSPVSGVFVPVYLVRDVNRIRAHVDAYWSEGTDLSNTCVEFMLVGDANVFHIDGGIASELFTTEITEPFAGLDRHSGRYDLELDLSDVLSGDYVLAITYGEPNYSEPNSCLVVQGLSVETDPNLRISIVGDLIVDGQVDWADLADLASTWLQPVPMSEKDLYPDAIIDLRDFTVFAEHWLEGSTP